MKKDVDYIVKDGEVLIVDEFTGRIMYGRRYNKKVKFLVLQNIPGTIIISHTSGDVAERLNARDSKSCIR